MSYSFLSPHLRSKKKQPAPFVFCNVFSAYPTLSHTQNTPIFPSDLPNLTPSNQSNQPTNPASLLAGDTGVKGHCEITGEIRGHLIQVQGVQGGPRKTSYFIRVNETPLISRWNNPSYPIDSRHFVGPHNSIYITTREPTYTYLELDTKKQLNHFRVR